MTRAAATTCVATRVAALPAPSPAPMATDGMQDRAVSTQGGHGERALRAVCPAAQDEGEHDAEHGAEQCHLGEPEHGDHLAVDGQRVVDRVGDAGDGCGGDRRSGAADEAGEPQRAAGRAGGRVGGRGGGDGYGGGHVVAPFVRGRLRTGLHPLNERGSPGSTGQRKSFSGTRKASAEWAIADGLSDGLDGSVVLWKQLGHAVATSRREW